MAAWGVAASLGVATMLRGLLASESVVVVRSARVAGPAGWWDNAGVPAASAAVGRGGAAGLGGGRARMRSFEFS